jgi:hypothetical protein
MNEINLKAAISVSDGSYSQLRNIVKAANMELVTDSYDLAKDIAQALKENKSEAYHVASRIRPNGNGTGMYIDFRNNEAKPYPSDGKTPNVNNVLNTVSELNKAESLPDIDTLTMQVYDLMEESNVFAVASERATMEYIKKEIDQGTKPDNIVSNFVDKRTTDGRLILSKLDVI